MSSMTETFQIRTGHQWRRATGLRPVERELASEVAVGIAFDGRPHTVLMSTPSDLEDLARGFTVTEAIAGQGDILGISSQLTPSGYLVDVHLDPGARIRRARPRTLEGRSSCGLCGVQRLADVVRPLPHILSDQIFSSRAVQSALEEMEMQQALGRRTRATHAAALADAQGRLLLLREDVGRHNALDKLAGAALSLRLDAGSCFVVVTSRCSFEMVEKTARLGAPMIVAISAPTDLAVSRAREAGITLVALARTDGYSVFTRPERLGQSVAEFEET